MELTGFKSITYNQLQTQLNTKFKTSGKTLPELAVVADLKSVTGVQNAFEFDEQRVSDKTLTSILEAIGIPAIVVWTNGERKYYLSTKLNF